MAIKYNFWSRYDTGNVFPRPTQAAATLTEEDFVQLDKCRRPHNRLGFAYQVAFVRLFDRSRTSSPLSSSRNWFASVACVDDIGEWVNGQNFSFT
jgi:hypothetical protein